MKDDIFNSLLNSEGRKMFERKWYLRRATDEEIEKEKKDVESLYEKDSKPREDNQKISDADSRENLVGELIDIIIYGPLFKTFLDLRNKSKKDTVDFRRVTKALYELGLLGLFCITQTCLSRFGKNESPEEFVDNLQVEFCTLFASSNLIASKRSNIDLPFEGFFREINNMRADFADRYEEYSVFFNEWRNRKINGDDVFKFELLMNKKSEFIRSEKDILIDIREERPLWYSHCLLCIDGVKKVLEGHVEGEGID